MIRHYVICEAPPVIVGYGWVVHVCVCMCVPRCGGVFLVYPLQAIKCLAIMSSIYSFIYIINKL